MVDCFRIVQELNIEWVDDELLDIDEHIVGYVEDEFFAQEFCNTHNDCYYHPIHIVKYPNELESKLIRDYKSIKVLKVPIKYDD